MEDGSIDPALPEFFQDDLNGDPLQDLNLLTEFLDPRVSHQPIYLLIFIFLIRKPLNS